jgi:hypothetical protein
MVLASRNVAGRTVNVVVVDITDRLLSKQKQKSAIVAANENDQN